MTSILERLPLLRQIIAIRKARQELNRLEELLGMGSMLNGRSISAAIRSSRQSQTVERGPELDELRDEISRLNYFSGLQSKLLPRVDSAANGEEVVVHSVSAFWSEISHELNEIGASTALDIGPGVRPFSMRRFELHICLEPFGPYLEVLEQRYKGTGILPLRGSAPNDLSRFATNQVESVFLVDVIEHLEKEDGLMTIREAKRIASKSVHIFTPLGFMEQHVGPLDDDVWGYVGNTLQTHLSGWEPSDFPGWRILLNPNYHKLGDKTFGAMWASFVKEQELSTEKPVAEVDIVFSEPTDFHPLLQEFVNAALAGLNVSNIWIHPELAPWSFRTRPSIMFPLELARILPSAPVTFRNPVIQITRSALASDILQMCMSKILKVTFPTSTSGEQHSESKKQRALSLSSAEDWGPHLEWLTNPID